jgi:uridine kinase
MKIVNDISSLTHNVLNAFTQHDKQSAFTVAISGIDASGKGYTAKLLQGELESKGYKVANLNIDPWQNPIPMRLRDENAAANVYKNVFKWDDFFEQLVFPLQKTKSIYLATQGIRSDADVYYPLIYDHKNIDVLLIEGILLFKKKYLSLYDYKIWVNCSFETGLQRAIHRNVEKLEKERLIRDYEKFYYAAQRMHFREDDPQKTADVIFYNDLVLSEGIRDEQENEKKDN